MSLTANIDPTENAFTGNPVYLSVETYFYGDLQYNIFREL